MGGSDKFKKNLGGVTINAVVPKPLPNGQPAGGRAGANYVELNYQTKFTEWTVVHELAHAWDANNFWGLSSKLQLETGGATYLRAAIFKKAIGACGNASLPGCNNAGYFYGDVPPKGSGINFNRFEDFAESVAAYVYPDVATAKVQKSYAPSSPLYYKNYRSTKRWSLVYSLMQ
jgi:hypothetical protein